MIVLCCLLSHGCKDDDKSKEGDADKSAPVPSASESGDDGTSKPGRGLAATFQDALAGKRSIKSLGLIPKGAVVLAGANVQELVSVPLWNTMQSKLGGRQRDQMDAATKCGVGSDKWRRFVIGLEPESNEMAMVVEAEGLGTRPVLDCLVEEIGSFELSEDGKRMSDVTGGGIVVSDDAVAFASPAWMPLLEKRIEGEGEAAVDDLAAVLARADQAKTLWLAGKSYEEVEQASSMLGAEIQDYTGWIDFRDGMSLRISITVPDAQKTREELESKWEGTKGMMNSVMPSAVVDSVELTDDGERVHLDVHASNVDLEETVSKMAGAF